MGFRRSHDEWRGPHTWDQGGLALGYNTTPCRLTYMGLIKAAIAVG